MFILPNKHACAILHHVEMLGNTKVFLRVRRHMPKRTTYLLRWLEEQQCYEMMGGLPDAAIPQPTSPEWLAWLSSISSFAFVCRSGTHYTARKEKLQRGVLVQLLLASGQDHQALYWQDHRSLYRPPGRGGNSCGERKSALVFSASASCADEEQHSRDQGAGGQTHSDALVMGKRQHN